jgi:RNA polymerase sigma factor (sigma-70 family)
LEHDPQLQAAENLRAPVEADLLNCAPGLKLILMRLTKNIDTAQELLQDVLLNCLNAIRAGRIASVHSLPAYAREAARNAAFGHVKSTRISTVAYELDDNLWAQSVQSPLDVCESGELQRLTQTVLLELPDRDQAVIRSFYVQGKSKVELLAQFGLNADHFDKVLSRARLRMRELLHRKMGDSSDTVSGSGAHNVLAAERKS